MKDLDVRLLNNSKMMMTRIDINNILSSIDNSLSYMKFCQHQKMIERMVMGWDKTLIVCLLSVEE